MFSGPSEFVLGFRVKKAKVSVSSEIVRCNALISWSALSSSTACSNFSNWISVCKSSIMKDLLAEIVWSLVTSLRVDIVLGPEWLWFVMGFLVLSTKSKEPGFEVLGTKNKEQRAKKLASWCLVLRTWLRGS